MNKIYLIFEKGIQLGANLVKASNVLQRHQLQVPILSLAKSFTLWEMQARPTFLLRKEHEALFKKPLLDGKPQMKGVVLKTVIKKPKKPNSGNRKSVVVRLSNGKEACAYVPGQGHNLQEHNIVLVRGGRTQDVPGLKLKVVRGACDCSHVKK